MGNPPSPNLAIKLLHNKIGKLPPYPVGVDKALAVEAFLIAVESAGAAEIVEYPGRCPSDVGALLNCRHLLRVYRTLFVFAPQIVNGTTLAFAGTGAELADQHRFARR